MNWPVTRDHIWGCAVWGGRIGKDGYGVHWSHGKATRAHIAVWTEANGPVPDGLVLDHLCSNPLCVRLCHLEAVSQRENLFRRRQTYRVRIPKCQHGHDMKLNGMNMPTGGRVCRRCNQGEGGGSV